MCAANLLSPGVPSNARSGAAARRIALGEVKSGTALRAEQDRSARAAQAGDDLRFFTGVLGEARHQRPHYGLQGLRTHRARASRVKDLVDPPVTR